MKRKRKKKNVATSGDAVVDWIFAATREVLNQEDVQIVIVRRMEKRTSLIGRLYYGRECRHKFDGYCVHIDESLSERGKWRVFFHETLHILLKNRAEKIVRRGEDLLWARMSEEQKQIIASYFKKLLRPSRESSTKSGQKK